MQRFSRRDFIRLSALTACSMAISTGLSGCSGSDNKVEVSFKHGVASGDPLTDKVIIWTRATTSESSVDVDYEVATDEAFADIIHNGTVADVTAATDYTVKVDIQNLDAGSEYYYRFTSNGTVSAAGKMKTLPEGTVERVKMAVFSCANYPNGYFNAYDAASSLEDLDVSVHLGDYIYEYGMFEDDGTTPSYATENAESIGRVLPDGSDTECITVDDYRKRYALYHTDTGLQALHRAAPMIAVWDDHEIANDTYKDGAENHNADDGDFDARVEASLQAYFEWMPIRPVTKQKEIFRSFTFGDLVSMNMLETRIFGRDKQLSYNDYYNLNLEFDQASFVSDLTATDRTMLGTSQLQWLQGEFATSAAKWQVLGQQVLMGRMSLPAELLTSISKLDNPEMFGTTTEALLIEINTSISELVALKMKKIQGGTLTAEEEARLTTTLPYNLDAWDGYYVERETILGTAKAYGKNLVVLAGDTHNAWGNELKDMNGDAVGVELATTSVSSPGLESYLSIADTAQAAQLEGALALLVDDLKYANLYDRGFMEVIFTADKVLSNWHFVSNYDTAVYSENGSRAKTLQCFDGKKSLEDIV